MNQDRLAVHVIGQVSYKKGCPEKTALALKDRENQELVEEALKEILDTHRNYAKFCALPPERVKEYIKTVF